MTGPLLAAIASALLAGFFAACAMSVRSVSRGRLQHLADQNGGFSRLQRIVDAPAEHALALSLPRLVFTLATIVASLLVFAGLGEASTLTWPALGKAAALAAALLYVLSLAIPSSIAAHASDHLVHALAPFIRTSAIVAAPILKTLGFLDVVIRRLAGVRPLTEEEEFEQEIISVVSEGEHEGSLGHAEREMIESVVELRNTTVGQIMTPRTECEGFELTDDLAFIKQFIQAAGHSRIPVYDGDFDHVVGILYAKDLLRFLGRDVSSFKIRSVLRKPTFVPETKPLTHLLNEFQQNKVHMAIVLDEYGGTAGLVTIEDVLEEIVGEIEDEFEPATETPPSIEVDEEGRAVVVDARAYINDVNDELEVIGAALPENDGYDTVGGFVLATLGHMPASGEQWRQNGYIIHVLEAEPTRVNKVRITFRDHDEQEEEPSGDADARLETEPSPDAAPAPRADDAEPARSEPAADEAASAERRASE